MIDKADHMKRRQFIQTSLYSAAGALLQPVFADAGGLRTITYNVLQCSGWPKRIAKDRLGEFSSQLPARFAMELALYHPDIITFQECPSESVVKEIANRLDMNSVYFPSGENWPGALLTRFNILSSQNHPTVDGKRPPKLFTRHWGKAEVLNPKTNERYIVHSAHLHPQSKDIRYDEVTAMLKAMKSEMESEVNFILQGDLNHGPDMASYRRWLKAGLVDCYAKAGAGEPLTFRADSPFCRIDYIWVNKRLATRVKAARALHEGAFRLHRNDPGSFALSDHIPVLAQFK